MIIGHKISVQAATALLAAFAAVVVLAAAPSPAAAAPSYAWASQGGGTGDAYALGVSALPDGSSIITGSFTGTATFGTTPPLISTGLRDTFTAKVNADGSYAWAIRGGGTTTDIANGVSALADGSSIITGYFDGTATFGTTPPLISTGAYDTFTAKVNADGSYAWAIRAGGTGTDIATGVSALADGSSIITGEFEGSATFGTTTLISTGGSDVFTAKVNADGSYAWAIRGGGTGFDIATGVSALPDGSSIITGYFDGTATFGTTPPLISTGSADTFTARILADTPQAPVGASASAGILEATITWNAVAGGSVSSYTATASPGGASCTAVAPATTCTITNLTAGTSYTATVTATNPQGTSPASLASNAVTPTGVAPPGSFNLAVSKSGTGAGTVTSSPAGINCGSDCSETLVAGTSVTLTAAPASGSTFTAWSGAGCSGTSTCTVVMSEARAVAAQFTANAPPPKPSNVFPTPKVKAGANALSSSVRVPGPGTLTQRVTRNRTAAAVLTVCKTSAKATKAGWVKLTCKLSAATRTALRQRSLRVRVKTTFTPTGGLPASKTQVVTLKSQRPPPYTG